MPLSREDYNHIIERLNGTNLLKPYDIKIVDNILWPMLEDNGLHKSTLTVERVKRIIEYRLKNLKRDIDNSPLVTTYNRMKSSSKQTLEELLKEISEAENGGFKHCNVTTEYVNGVDFDKPVRYTKPGDIFGIEDGK